MQKSVPELVLAAVTKMSPYKNLALRFRFCYTARGGFCFPEEAIQEFHGNQNYRHASFNFLGQLTLSSNQNH